MRIDIKTLIHTDIPQKTAAAIFHYFPVQWHQFTATLLDGTLHENKVPYITVNLLWEKRLLKFRIHENAELFAAVYEQKGDAFELQHTAALSTDFILNTILKDYLL